MTDLFIEVVEIENEQSFQQYQQMMNEVLERQEMEHLSKEMETSTLDYKFNFDQSNKLPF